MASSIQYWLHGSWLIDYIICISLSAGPIRKNLGCGTCGQAMTLTFGRSLAKLEPGSQTARVKPWLTVILGQVGKRTATGL